MTILYYYPDALNLLKLYSTISFVTGPLNFVHKHTYTYPHTHAHTHTYTRTHMYTHSYTFSHAHSLVHSLTHSLTHSLVLSRLCIPYNVDTVHTCSIAVSSNQWNMTFVAHTCL